MQATTKFALPVFAACIIAVLASDVFQAACRNDLPEDECLKLKTNSVCYSSPKNMTKYCRKACGFCRPCQDNLVAWRCQQLKKLKLCQTYHKRMKLFCPETCGFCPYDCRDKYHNCPELKKKGYCLTESKAMRDVCGDSCGYCEPRTPCDTVQCPFNHKCIVTADMKAECQCMASCSKTSKTGPLCTKNGTTFKNLCTLRKEECRTGRRIKVKYYGKCSNSYTCKDAKRESVLCESWKKYNACQVYRNLMQFYCPKSCSMCRQPAPTENCAKSRFGCCWDTDKPAIGKGKKGCRACKDSKFCTYFAGQCGNMLNRGPMKKNCPATCGYCDHETDTDTLEIYGGQRLNIYALNAK